MNIFDARIAAAAFFLTVPAPASSAKIEMLPGNGTTPSIIDITGPIESGDADRFYDLARNSGPAVVTLQSPGGLVDDGLSIAAEIAQRGFATVVAPGAECYSVCAVIWVSGARKMMDSTSTIGVHAAYRNQALADGTSLSSESGVANADIGSFLTHVGLSREAIRYFTTAGPDEFLPITPYVAQRLDIDTAVSDGEHVSWPEDRPTPRRLARQAATYVGLSGDCATLLDLDSAFMREQGGQRLKLGHELFGGELYTSLVPELSEQVNSAIASMAMKDWCTGAARDLNGQGMLLGINGPGYDCTKATTSTELAVCESFDLWLEDRALSSIYSVLRNLSSAAERIDLVQAQRHWISQRDRCGSDTDCILDRYRAWFLDLSLMAKGR